MVVNMILVYMGADKELIFSLCPAHRRFVADVVSLLRRHLALRERLTDLVAQRAALGLAVCFPLILIFYHHKLCVGRGGITEVGGHRPQLLRVQAVVEAVFQTLQSRPLGGLLMGFDIGCGRGRPSSLMWQTAAVVSRRFCIFWPP